MNIDQNQQKQERLERLSSRSRKESHYTTLIYTKFVHIMRIILPLSAIIIIAILYLRSGLKKQVITPIEQITNTSEFKNKSISRNELLNPKFESVDKQNQPYQITASRAIQGEINKNLIMLEHPTGTITMKDGLKIKLRSNTGAYRQDTKRFFLKGDVFLNHAGGYKLQTEEAHIDLKKGFAWSEKEIKGSGPDFIITAHGVHANNNNGEIFFTGPTKLILKNNFKIGGK